MGRVVSSVKGKGPVGIWTDEPLGTGAVLHRDQWSREGGCVKKMMICHINILSRE
jgi:hypothetical protein